MTLGRVVGVIVATRKDPRLEGSTLLIVKPVAPDGKEEPATRSPSIPSARATASWSSRSPAPPRAWPRAARKAVDCVVVGIVDGMSVDAPR